MSLLRTKPRFITPDDFNNYTGKNLDEILQVDSNVSNAANLFLMRIEDCLLARVDKESFRVVPWGNLTNFQKESLQKAIIYQTEYILRSSDLFTDSGYDLEKGEVMSFDKIQRIAICEVSRDLLTNCGLFNKTISNRRRYTHFY